MKTKLHFLFITLTVFGAVHQAAAQGTAFTYQGALNNGTNPVTGLYDFKFTVFAASSGGSATGGPVTNTAVPVTNGLFTTIIDFGDGVFTGSTNWLRVQVVTNGGSPFVTLLPRQELTPTPYAIFAETADAAGLSGTLPASGLSGTYAGPVALTNVGNSFTGNGSGLTNLNASLLGGLAASNFWQTTGNAGTSPGVNFLGTSDNEPLMLRANGEVGLELPYKSLSSGSPPFLLTQSSINLIGGYWGNGVSGGVVGGTIAGGGGFSRLGINNYTSPNTVTASYGTVGGGADNMAGNYGTVPGGAANVANGLYSFAAGQAAQALHQGAFVWADSESPVFASTGNDQFLIRAQGGVGIGTASPEQALSVNGGISLDSAGLNAGFVNNGNTNGYGLTFGISSGEGIASDRVNGVNRYGLDFYTSFAHRMSILQNGKVGIGTTNPVSLLEVNGDVRIDGNHLYLEPGGGGSFQSDGLTWGDPGLGGINNGGQGPWLAGYEGGALGALNPNVVALSWDASGDVEVSSNLTVGREFLVVTGLTPVQCYLGDDGSGKDVQIGSLKSGVTAVSCYNEADQAYMHLYVSSITIKGGSDLAEPFKITSGADAVPQGAVVVIDEQNPGHLKLSNQSYDTHVAGVVSGANGINPGIQMEQQGLLDGGQNVALTGRVYVQADTSNGAIKPGDLLTTSSNHGRAMKVTDHARAAGAILGKAMTGLSQGKGMVLVLVTLQ